MPKMRGIKAEFWTDDKIVGLDPHARLLFIGMWNFACDNGHLDDSALQLKMRILPADNVDIAALVDSLVETGVLDRRAGYLKVVNLAEHQRIDTRFLSLCDHCDADPSTRFDKGDKKPRTKGDHSAAGAGTTSARRAHDEHPSSAHNEGRKEGEEGSVAAAAAPPRPEVEALCDLLADLIEANGSKRPTIGKGWYDAARLMLDRDKRDQDEARTLIAWAQGSEFWRPNILSMPKFRDKYDQLRLQAESSGALRPRHLKAVGWDAPTVDQFEYHDE